MFESQSRGLTIQIQFIAYELAPTVTTKYFQTLPLALIGLRLSESVNLNKQKLKKSQQG